MIRQIYVVDASVVDANGTYNKLSGYPKTFDSKNYDNDIDKTQKRAEGEFSTTWGAMCKVDSRQVQMVMLMTADGFIIEKKSSGKVADIPDPTPEPETEPEEADAE